MTRGDEHILIIGGGFSGTLLAINLVRHRGPRATLVERAPARLGAGVAYSATHRSQLLNVRAAGMSAFPDAPDHFVRWLATEGGVTGQSFVPRATYGAYLRATLAEVERSAPSHLALRTAEVVDLDADGAVLADGRHLAADRVVLAVGNLPPHAPPGIDPARLPDSVFHTDPWSDAVLDDLRCDDTVLLLGTGLTAIDVALKLDDAGFGGRIVALSRRGLVPRPHVEQALPVQGRVDTPDLPLSALLHELRATAAATDWRSAVDALRPVTQRLWAAGDAAWRARFLRHLRPYWDVHRHRIAPAVAERIVAMEAAGRLVFRAGKITDAVATTTEDAVRIDWRPRGEDATSMLLTRRIVNCTGPQGDLTRTDQPLLRALLDRGAIRPDALRLGIEVDPQSRVVDAHGAPNERLHCIGPMTRGGLWEVVAVPDLRKQSWDLARRLSNAQWVGGEGL